MNKNIIPSIVWKIFAIMIMSITLALTLIYKQDGGVLFIVTFIFICTWWIDATIKENLRDGSE